MNWVILVLIATVIWSVSAIINKFARVRYFENSLGYLIFITPTSLFVLALLFFEPLTILHYKEAFFAILTGVLVTIAYYLYLEAIHREELSKVYILFGTAPLFVLIISTIFLKETLNINQYIAFTLIFIGSVLISFKKVEEKIKLTTGVLLILLSSFFFAIQDVTFKYISGINLTTTMFYREGGYIFSIAIILLASKKARKHARKVMKDLDLRKTALVYSAEILGMIGLFLVYLAIQRGPVSLVTVTQGFETIFILIFTIVISLLFPKILKEESSMKTITIKIISIILMIGGLYLIVK